MVHAFHVSDVPAVLFRKGCRVLNPDSSPSGDEKVAWIEGKIAPRSLQRSRLFACG